MSYRAGLVLLFALPLVGPALAASDSVVATLYRSSVVIENARLHVATFDADAPFDYNWENCQLAADLFAAQPGVKVRFWCEKGRYRE